MKKILAAVAIVIMSLTGCANTSESNSDTPRSGGNTQSNQFSVNDEFLADIGLYNTPELEAQPDDDLIFLGHTVCEALDTGASFNMVIAAGSGTGGLSSDSMGTVAASSIVNFCPEHR